MPHKDKRGGIYVITTPAGNEYGQFERESRKRYLAEKNQHETEAQA